MDLLQQVLIQNKDALKHWIQNENNDAHQKKSVFEIYLSFCKAMDTKQIPFVDFEVWYDSEVRKSNFNVKNKETAEFENLPMDIVRKVLNWLDPVSRIMLRHVSKTLKNCVDTTKMNIEELKILATDHSWTFIFPGNQNLKYEKTAIGFCICSKDQSVLMKGGNFITTALQDLNQINMRTLQLSEVEWFNQRLPCDTKQLDTKIRVEDLTCNSLEMLRLFLEQIEPSSMENITLKNKELDLKAYEWRQIFHSEHWKQVKNIRITGKAKYFWLFSIMDSLTHFESFDVTVSRPSFTELDQLRQKIYESPTFKKCVIRTQKPIDYKLLTYIFKERFAEEYGTFYTSVSVSKKVYYVVYQHDKIIIEKYWG